MSRKREVEGLEKVHQTHLYLDILGHVANPYGWIVGHQFTPKGDAPWPKSLTTSMTTTLTCCP